MKAFRIFFRSIRDAFKSVLRNFSLSFASIMCTTITLILVSISILVATNVDNSTKLLENELTIIVYLKADIKEEQIENITAELKAYKNIEDVEFKSSDEWKLEMSEYDDVYATILNYIDTNPLLNSYIVRVKDVKKLADTTEYIKSIDGVETAKYGEKAAENVISILDIIEKVVLVVVVALVLVTGFLISNTIKLTIFSRRNEIEIMRLVGASNTSIKLPFLFEGLIIGIIGAIIPICVTIYGYVILFTKLHGRINILVLIQPFNYILWVALILLGIGALVGMYGSVKAVRKYLKI